MILQRNGCNHPVATSDSPLSKRPTSRLGCIAWLFAFYGVCFIVVNDASASRNRLLRTRMLGGVGRVIRKDGPYPISPSVWTKLVYRKSDVSAERLEVPKTQLVQVP
jgi:hypothetical protein